MAVTKSLDEYKLIAALTSDVYTSYGGVFNAKTLRLTLKQLNKRVCSEGMGFLTKTLPRLGKAFDKALAEMAPLNCTDLREKSLSQSNLPMLFGELFSRVLKPDGTILATPCVASIKHIRQLLYLFYKYELPYSDEQEQQVLAKFYGTEHELEQTSIRIRELSEYLDTGALTLGRQVSQKTTSTKSQEVIAREAKRLLSELFVFFDPKDIKPRHGPGAVATKQKLWRKYLWSNISAKITKSYPSDEYFFSSLGHVCDRIDMFKHITQEDLPARVLLVPKDSRGPRLISCEPVDYQWVQQGLGRAIVQLVENHYLTRYSVFFSDQVPNQKGALLGSFTGGYSTLDLNEASDRVSLDLVRLLFPSHIYEFLANCRSSSTVLPDGLVLPLRKFAPMGSSLCFPIMALTIWALLAAGLTDTASLLWWNRRSRIGRIRFQEFLSSLEEIHVYGDDVIVPTAKAADAMNILESFGLKINRDKSYTSGFFRESCGTDAFKGIEVTPVRLHTVWSSTPSPECYPSWVAYANSFWDRHYYRTYDEIVGALHRVYGAIPSDDMGLNGSCPCLRYVHDDKRPKKYRINHDFQKKEWLVRCIKSKSVHKEIDGWSMLLRFFAEGDSTDPDLDGHAGERSIYVERKPFRVRSYTHRNASKLAFRWR